MRQMLRALRPGELGDADMQRLVDALRPVAAAARFQLQQVGIEVLDVGGEIERLGHVFVADVAIGDEAHADLGVRVGVDDGGRDRPDLAFGAFDQRAHRAGGVEHERDLDNWFDPPRSGGLLLRRRPGGRDGKDSGKTREHQSPRNKREHGMTLLLENCERRTAFPSSRLPEVRIAARASADCGGFGLVRAGFREAAKYRGRCCPDCGGFDLQAGSDTPPQPLV